MVCESCENTVRKSLENVQGIKHVEIDLATEQVIVETSLPSEKVKNILESTGKQVRLIAVGSGIKVKENLGAAVAIMEIGDSVIKGVVRFVQSTEKKCLIEGTIDGLPPGKHPLCVHEYGDVSEECKSCGPILGMLGLTEKAKGIITELQVGELGRAEFRIENDDVKVWDIIGRSLVIHNNKLDIDPHNRLSCGIIARSAGLFQNSKKFCACDGIGIWDENKIPKSSGIS